MTTHRQRGVPKVVIWPTNELKGRLDISKLVTHFQCQKDLQQPAGRWSVTLLPRQSDQHQSTADIRFLAELYRIIQINNVVSIGFEEPGGIMLGLVDRVARTRVVMGENVMQGVTLTGSDFGKALAVDHVIQASLAVPELASFLRKIEVTLGAGHPLLIALPGVWGPTTRDGVPTFLGQSVDAVLDFILKNAATLRIPLMAEATGGTGLPADYISTDFSVTTWNDSRVFADALHSYQGSVWGFVTSVLDRDFYEIVLQTSPNGSALANLELVIRPKPFDSKLLDFAPTSENTGITWESLRTFADGKEYHEIAFDEVLQENVGVSDAESMSYYLVTAEHELIGNVDALKEGLSYPVVDTFNAKFFGLRPYQTRLSLVSGDIRRKAAGTLDYDGEVAIEVREFRNRLLNWYRLNPFFETGSITVVGRDRFRPGDPFFMPWAQAKIGDGQGLRYYCPQMQWMWKYGGNYTCTLQVTRGQNPEMIEAVKERILDDAPFENLRHLAET